MDKIKVFYDIGWCPSLIQYTVELTDTEIVFYDLSKKNCFRLRYSLIDYVNLIYAIFSTLDCWIYLKSYPLADLNKEEAKLIKKWFPPCNRVNFQFIRFFTNYKHKDNIIKLLNDNNVKIEMLPFQKPFQKNS